MHKDLNQYQMVVTKRIQTNYNTILQGKIYFFLKKSVWMYLLGMLLLGYTLPFGSFGLIPSTFIYFFAFIIIVLVPVYHFSAKMLAKRYKLDADFVFSEQNITITHRDKDLVEIKEWAWVKQIDITAKSVFFVVNYPHRFLITLNKSDLSDSEWQFFNKMKSERNKTV